LKLFIIVYKIIGFPLAFALNMPGLQKIFFLLVPTMLCTNLLYAQFYCKGEIVDANTKKGIARVRIFLSQSKNDYFTGYDGSFGIMSRSSDSLICTQEGYETQTVKTSNTYLVIALKPLPTQNSKIQQRFTTLTKDYNLSESNIFNVGNESYFNVIENQELITNKFPNTSFTLNTDKASYSNIRRFVQNKETVPANVVRIEEVLNYFGIDYSNNTSTENISYFSTVSDCPWNANKKLLHLQFKSKIVPPQSTKPNKLTYLIDCSGSMDEDKRLPVVQAAFKMLTQQLRPTDTISIVTFGTDVITWLENTGGADKVKILKNIDSLYTAGDTPGERALETAYNIALKYYNKNANNRIILCTDGDFNVGKTEEDELGKLVSKYKESGIYLTCLGIGKGNFKNSKLEVLVKKGNGNLAYIDSEKEAEKILVKESLQTLVSVASNVSVDLIMNNTYIKNYRLLGFDNQIIEGAEKINELEGGTMGSGHIVTAIVEIELEKNTPLDVALASGFLKYTLDKDSMARTTNINFNYTIAKDPLLIKKVGLNNALTAYCLLLRNSKYFPNWYFKEVIKYATPFIDNKNFLEKDFLTLICNSQKIYPKRRKKSFKL
jgi:Ca-activated chloride channel homolog